MTLASTFSAGFIAGPGGGTVAGAEVAFAAALANGTAYFNVHTSAFPQGEIRGFFRILPEPSTFVLLGGAALLLACTRRRVVRAHG